MPSASRRHTELKVPIRLPSGAKTGPEVRPRVPESSTVADSGCQENGASCLSVLVADYILGTIFLQIIFGGGPA